LLRTYPKHPFVGVGVVVGRRADNGRGQENGRPERDPERDNGVDILLVRRGKPPYEGRWSLPGGAQKIGETVRNTAKREIQEETGIDIALLGLLDVVDYIEKDDAGDVRRQYALVDYAARWVSGPARAGDDVTEVVWTPINDLCAFDLWSETRRVIALADRMFRGMQGMMAE